jgi:hypothetical protein
LFNLYAVPFVPDAVLTVAGNPSAVLATQIASGCFDGSVKIWEATASKRICEEFQVGEEYDKNARTSESHLPASFDQMDVAEESSSLPLD